MTYTVKEAADDMQYRLRGRGSHLQATIDSSCRDLYHASALSSIVEQSRCSSVHKFLWSQSLATHCRNPLMHITFKPPFPCITLSNPVSSLDHQTTLPLCAKQRTSLSFRTVNISLCVTSGRIQRSRSERKDGRKWGPEKRSLFYGGDRESSKFSLR